MRNFRELEIWQEAIKLTKEVYLITKTFPPEEKYGITSQINRAVISISSNIAEGRSRQSEKDFSRFIEIALGSSFEVESLLMISFELGYIKKNELEHIVEKLQILQKRTNSLRNYLIKKPV